MLAGVAARQQVEKLVPVDKAVTFQPGASDRGADTVGIAHRERQVDQAVACEVRVQRDVEQPTLAMRRDRRHAGDRFGVQPAVGEQPQSTRALGDQDAAVGQERHAPRVLEALGEGHDAERTRPVVRAIGRPACDHQGREKE